MGCVDVPYDVVTELRYDGDRVEFGVRTDQRLFQDRLVKMGWRRLAPGAFSRRLSNAGDVERIFDNFTGHLREMLLQSARLRPVHWEAALAEFIDRVHDSGLHWWLYGSGALAVRGLDVEPGDLDLAVDDPQLAGALLDDLLVEPVSELEGWVADTRGPSILRRDHRVADRCTSNWSGATARAGGSRVTASGNDHLARTNSVGTEPAGAAGSCRTARTHPTQRAYPSSDGVLNLRWRWRIPARDAQSDR